ncbi:hypothetical protein ACU4GD_35505 [Cupriavidus basilensis]
MGDSGAVVRPVQADRLPALPRPTRPRNWCNWAPGRNGSAWLRSPSSDAFGTSTPTSITVCGYQHLQASAWRRGILHRAAALFSPARRGARAPDLP